MMFCRHTQTHTHTEIYSALILPLQQALRFLLDNSFTGTQGARPGVAKVGIVFTDGRSQDYIGDAAKKAKENGERTGER